MKINDNNTTKVCIKSEVLKKTRDEIIIVTNIITGKKVDLKEAVLPIKASVR